MLRKEEHTQTPFIDIGVVLVPTKFWVRVAPAPFYIQKLFFVRFFQYLTRTESCRIIYFVLF